MLDPCPHEVCGSPEERPWQGKIRILEQIGLFYAMERGRPTTGSVFRTVGLCERLTSPSMVAFYKWLVNENE